LLGKGRITVASVETFVADRVSRLTEGKQTPTVAKPQTIPDFVIALRAGWDKVIEQACSTPRAIRGIASLDRQ
jgi:hypothetical protein